MTEITIQIPSQILIEESQTLERNRIPLIPATQITGQLLPEQVPLGVIPGLENFEQLDTMIQEVSDRVGAIEQNDYLTGPELEDFLGPVETQLAAVQTGLESKAPLTEISPLAQAIASLSASLAALQSVVSDKAPTDHSQPIASINGLTTALNDLQAQINNLQSSDADLTALAALTTQPFGRSLLTLANLAAAKALLEIPSAVTGQPTASELSYTVSQSTINANSTALTEAVLRDGNLATGGATTSGGTNWIKADLGSNRTIESMVLGGGSVPNVGTTSGMLNSRTVQVSLDDLMWTPLFAISGVTSTETATFPIPTVKARYLRIIATANNVGATELRIFGY